MFFTTAAVNHRSDDSALYRQCAVLDSQLQPYQTTSVSTQERATNSVCLTTLLPYQRHATKSCLLLSPCKLFLRLQSSHSLRGRCGGLESFTLFLSFFLSLIGYYIRSISPYNMLDASTEIKNRKTTEVSPINLVLLFPRLLDFKKIVSENRLPRFQPISLSNLARRDKKSDYSIFKSQSWIHSAPLMSILIHPVEDSPGKSIAPTENVLPKKKTERTLCLTKSGKDSRNNLTNKPRDHGGEINQPIRGQLPLTHHTWLDCGRSTVNIVTK